MTVEFLRRFVLLSSHGAVCVCVCERERELCVCCVCVCVFMCVGVYVGGRMWV
jgi:hypothetical protein